MDQIQVKEFYKGRDIFVTGGLGYLGKILIEKLLRSCGDLNHIYVLARSKKNKSPKERLDGIVSTNLFDTVRNNYPSRLKKVIAVNGDVQLEGMGLNANDMQLMHNVSIIFHSAATVRFDESMKQSILVNTKGTYEIMKFAQKLPNIKSVVHVSTTFCNLDRMYLEEKVYPPYANWKDMIDAALNNDVKTLDEYVESNLKNKHNTYTLSKHLAEQVANDYRDILPVLIFRPAVVLPVLTDPVPGWVDNHNGPVGICTGVAVGLVRTMYADRKVKTEYTPVDSCARCMIVAAYAMGTSQIRQKGTINVYNCSTPINNYEMTETTLRVLDENPFDVTLWAPNLAATSCPPYYYIRFFLYQLLPAIIADVFLLSLRKKPFLFKLQKQIYKSQKFYGAFIQKQWNVDQRMVKKLDSIIPKEEVGEFYFYDHMKFNLFNYMKDCVAGYKKNLLKEPEHCTHKTLLKYKSMIIAHNIIKILFCSTVAYIGYGFIVARLF